LQPGALILSAKQATGLDRLRQALLQAAGWQPAGSGAYAARIRHLDALHATS
jgi:tRNA modification GTPase